MQHVCLTQSIWNDAIRLPTLPLSLSTVYEKFAEELHSGFRIREKKKCVAEHSGSSERMIDEVLRLLLSAGGVGWPEVEGFGTNVGPDAFQCHS